MPSGPEMLAVADDMIAEGGLAAVASVLSLFGEDPDLAASEWGQLILIDAVSHVIEGLAHGQVQEAALALADCSQSAAILARDLLVGVIFPDGKTDVMSLDDPALACLALLIAASGDKIGALGLIEQAVRRNSTLGLIQTAGALNAHVVQASALHSERLLAAH